MYRRRPQARHAFALGINREDAAARLHFYSVSRPSAVECMFTKNYTAEPTYEKLSLFEAELTANTAASRMQQ